MCDQTNTLVIRLFATESCIHLLTDVSISSWSFEIIVFVHFVRIKIRFNPILVYLYPSPTRLSMGGGGGGGKKKIFGGVVFWFCVFIFLKKKKVFFNPPFFFSPPPPPLFGGGGGGGGS